MVEVLSEIHVIDLSDSEISSLEVFLLDCSEGLILIDAGVKESDLDLIHQELEAIGKTWKDVKICLITHRHGDHISNLARVKELSEADFMAHVDEVKEIEDATGVVVKELKHGEKLPYCGGIEVVHVPGHTRGNSCYYLPERKLMIAGDTVFGDEVGSLTPPPEMYCLDVEEATREIKRLLEYDFDALLITHGKNILKDAKKTIEELCEKTS